MKHRKKPVVIEDIIFDGFSGTVLRSSYYKSHIINRESDKCPITLTLEDNHKFIPQHNKT